MSDLYDLLVICNCYLFEEDGGAMGGTERQILSVAESLAQEGLNVALVHSLKEGTDKVINDVKHLNKYRHHFDYSKVRLHVNQPEYTLNGHGSYRMSTNHHVPHVTSIEKNCADKTFQWFHNWFFMTQNVVPRIFNSKAVRNYVMKDSPYSRITKPFPDDQVIYYMVPRGLKQKPQQNRGDYLFWMSAFGKGMKEAVLMYISLYERGLTNRPFRLCVPPQRDQSDIDICWQMIHDVGRKRYPIEFLGALDYDSVMFELSNAACLFRAGSPQETFGLVYLEANQLEVPVLTFKGDAGEEILQDKNNFIIDQENTLKEVGDWLVDIDKKKTKVDMEKFDPKKITQDWIKLIENA
jgi:glycosyltransferase involved in cell wall biosynthesis